MPLVVRTGLAAALLAAAIQCNSACDEIAVLSWRAQYILLDADTLEMSDVGNLWWHGVFGVDTVFRGSTSRRFGFSTDTLSSELTRIGGDGLFPKSALVTVDWTDGNTRNPITISHESAELIDDPIWIENTDRLLASKKAGDQWRIEVRDVNLGVLDTWQEEAKGWEGPLFACLDEDRIILGWRSHRAVRQNGRTFSGSFAMPAGVEQCAVSTRPLGCLVRMSCRRSGSSSLGGVIDVADNDVVASFEANALGSASRTDRADHGVWLSGQGMFLDGTRTLEQETISTLLEGGGVRITQGSRLRVLDTATGRVVAKNEDAPVMACGSPGKGCSWTEPERSNRRPSQRSSKEEESGSRKVPACVFSIPPRVGLWRRMRMLRWASCPGSSAGVRRSASWLPASGSCT